MELFTFVRLFGVLDSEAIDVQKSANLPDRKVYEKHVLHELEDEKHHGDLPLGPPVFKVLRIQLEQCEVEKVDLKLLSIHVCEIAHDLLAVDQAIARSKQDDSESRMFHSPLGSHEKVKNRHKEACKRKKPSKPLSEEFFSAQLPPHLKDTHQGLADSCQPHSACQPPAQTSSVERCRHEVLRARPKLTESCCCQHLVEPGVENHQDYLHPLDYREKRKSVVRAYLTAKKTSVCVL